MEENHLEDEINMFLLKVNGIRTISDFQNVFFLIPSKFISEHYFFTHACLRGRVPVVLWLTNWTLIS